MELRARAIEKPWGRTEIPAVFGSANGRRIGEIWFERTSGPDLPLLVKYIFTSEKLSVQVHPSDEQARARNLDRGKTECWYILEADEGATIGIGLRSRLTPEEIRKASLDGSIEQQLEWRPVAAGDFIYVPAGTIHAIGAGVSLLEFQQNTDVTYRLYDYGRPRELHLEDGVEVAQSNFDALRYFRPSGGPTDTVLANTSHFTLVRASTTEAIPPSLNHRARWVMPLEGSVTSAGSTSTAGACLYLDPGAPLAFSADAVVLVGAEGALQS